MWAAEHETRAQIIDRYRRACDHSDATIGALGIDAPGHVPWWPRPDVKLFNVMVHVLTETTRHAGHADILREQLDGTVGMDGQGVPLHGRGAAYWESYRAKVEQAGTVTPSRNHQPGLPGPCAGAHPARINLLRRMLVRICGSLCSASHRKGG